MQLALREWPDDLSLGMWVCKQLPVSPALCFSSAKWRQENLPSRVTFSIVRQFMLSPQEAQSGCPLFLLGPLGRSSPGLPNA